MKREMNLGNVIGITGAVLVLLGMFLPCFEFLYAQISWYQLVVDYGGMTGLGMWEIIGLIAIILLAGYLFFAGYCGTGLLIGVASSLYFIKDYVASIEELQSNGVHLEIGAGLIIIGEIAIIAGGFAGALLAPNDSEKNPDSNSSEGDTVRKAETKQDTKNAQEKADGQSSSDKNTENLESTICPYCKGILKEKTRFCPDCGAKLAFCSGCNRVLKEESKFCPYCGAKQQEK